MPWEQVEGAVFSRLFTFSPPKRASQFSDQTAIDDRPGTMPSPLNYPAYYTPEVSGSSVWQISKKYFAGVIYGQNFLMC